jgi:hypothetical protein
MVPRSDIGAQVHAAKEGRPGATASFPYDRLTVERFREAFPRARWRDDLRVWFVPGPTAGRRLDRWLARELSGLHAHADARGKDAFAFDPIDSRYLEAADDLLIRAPYSKTIVAELQAVPWAWWDGELRVWRVPFRSWEEFRRRWPTIEAAAQRNEPEERRKRREALKNSPEHQKALAGESERRRRRYPVPDNALPSLHRVLMTKYGAAIFTDITGECVDDDVAQRFYPSLLTAGCNLIWASWRKPSHAELVKAWPSRWPASEAEIARGWWQPTLAELREERRKTRSTERGLATRQRSKKHAAIP